MDILMEMVLWGSLGISGFAYGGYTLVGRVLKRWMVREGEMV